MRRISLFFMAILLHAGALRAQELPLRDVPVELAREGGNRWRAGPLVLTLPQGWTSGRRIHADVLVGPAGAEATFLMLVATPEARRDNYSVLSDPARGPHSFWADLSDCAATGRGQPVQLQTNDRYVVYVSCTVMAQGRPVMAVEGAVYSKHHLVPFSVLGAASEVETFIAALRTHEWREP